MDPITPVVVAGGLASDFAIGKVLDTLSSKVVGYWSDYRARQFAATFISAVAADNPTGVQERIDAFARDPRKSAALFDAYRRVALSASPVLGPRIIALVMAQIVFEDRQPSEIEEQVLAAARELNDSELIAARADWLRMKPSLKPDNLYSAKSPIRYYECHGGHDGAYGYWLHDGSWGGKLSSLGFMWSSPRIRIPSDYGDSGPPELSGDLYWAAAYPTLVDFIDRAKAIGPTASITRV